MTHKCPVQGPEASSTPIGSEFWIVSPGGERIVVTRELSLWAGLGATWDLRVLVV